MGGLDAHVELDQVLEDQWAPAVPARLHKKSAFRKPAKLDRRESQLSRKRTDLRCCAVIVTRQEHDPPTTVDGRDLIECRGDQMIEPLDQPGTTEGLRDCLGRRLPPELL